MNFLNKLSILALIFVNFAAFGMEGGAAQEAAGLTLDQQLLKYIKEIVKKEDAVGWLIDYTLEKRRDELESLLKRGASINAPDCMCKIEGANPLVHAIWLKNIDLIKFLLEKGAAITMLVESAAIESNNEEIKKVIQDAKEKI